MILCNIALGKLLKRYNAIWLICLIYLLRQNTAQEIREIYF